MKAAEIEAATAPWDVRVAPVPSFAIHFARMHARREEGAYWALVLLGETGRGKTKAAAMAMTVWCETTGRPGLWINPPEDLITVMRERYDGGGFSDLEDSIKESSFLVLDDVGREREGTHATAVSDWLCARERRKLPTLITSNAASANDLGDARIASRLGEGVVLSSRWDYRDFRAAQGGV